MPSQNLISNLTYTTNQGSRVSWLAQVEFAAFGKGVQLISGFPFVETEHIPEWPRQVLYFPPTEGKRLNLDLGGRGEDKAFRGHISTHR